MADSATLLTLEDYAALDEPDDTCLTELVKGVVVREPRPQRTHGRIQVRLAHRLQSWALEHGAEVTAESGYILSEDPATVRGPDVAVVLHPEAVRDGPGGWPAGAPDVAVEVVSPSDGSIAMQMKVLDYLEAGARLVWIVDPGSRTVRVHRPDGTGGLLGESERLDGEDVLEGFALPLDELFR